MKNTEQTPHGESALVAQMNLIQRQLNDWGALSSETRIEQIEAIHASYDPAMLSLIRTLSNTMDVQDYISLLNDSHKALINSKAWRSWDNNMRYISAYSFHVMMDFLINLRVILEKRSLEREIRGI